MSRRESAVAVLQTTWVCNAGHVHDNAEICGGTR